MPLIVRRTHHHGEGHECQACAMEAQALAAATLRLRHLQEQAQRPGADFAVSTRTVHEASPRRCRHVDHPGEFTVDDLLRGHWPMPFLTRAEAEAWLAENGARQRCRCCWPGVTMPVRLPAPGRGEDGRYLRGSVPQ